MDTTSLLILIGLLVLAAVLAGIGLRLRRKGNSGVLSQPSTPNATSAATGTTPADAATRSDTPQNTDQSGASGGENAGGDGGSSTN